MRFVVGGVFLIVSIVSQLRVIFLFSQMMDEVNRLLPGESQIPAFGPSWLRGKVFRLHRQFYPASKLRRNVYKWWVIEMIAFLTALACVVRFV